MEALCPAGLLGMRQGKAGVALSMAGAGQFGQQARQGGTEGVLPLGKQIQSAAIGPGDHRHIVFGFHPAFNFQAADARLHQLGQERHQVQVLGGENVGAVGILAHGQVFAGALLLHHGVLPAAGLGAGALIAAASRQHGAEQAPAGIGHAGRAMHKGLQLHAIVQLGAHGLHALEAHLTGEDHPFAAQRLVVLHRRGIHRAGLGADVEGQLRHLFPQGHNGANVANDSRVHANAMGDAGGLHIVVQLVVEGHHVHGEVELLALFMHQAHRLAELLLVEIACKGAQTKALHAAVDRIRAKVQGGAQALHAASGAEQLRHFLHHWIPLDWSYSFHRGA